MECGADALGFIRVRESPRFVPDEHLGDLLWEERLFIPQVAVVRSPADAGKHGWDYVQFSQEGPGESGRQNGGILGKVHGVSFLAGVIDHEAGMPYPRLIRTFQMRDTSVLDEISRYPYAEGIAAYHLDTYHKDKLGGAGETFNWDLAVEAKKLTDKPIILAGGLTPENVQEAIAKVRPYAVDVSSGVEAEPGRKDHAKLKAFVRAVREWDLRHG